jgi:hypothetical protein
MSQDSNDKIFVQIAAYRDPQLVLTLKSLVDKALNPNNLTICIAWQHDTRDEFDKDLEEFKNSENRLGDLIIIDIPAFTSKGACWARNLIQQHYKGEGYTLQIDSHMRFVEHWDRKCIDMVKQLQADNYEKPLLTGYVSSFDPDDDTKFVQEPWKMKFDRFIPEGAVFFLPETIDEWKHLSKPVPARFYSAHFCFTLGQMCKEVPHDPEYYFHGEEISIAVRAFTHGYDLFHPHLVICWHEYTRKGRTKHWDDHVESNKETIPWVKRNDSSHKRNRCLFSMDGESHDSIEWGIYDFGNKRTVKQYEDYAGINFKLRLAQKFTMDNVDYPPNPIVYKSESEWKQKCIKGYDIPVDIDKKYELGEDVAFWFVGVQNASNDELGRKDFDRDKLDKIKKENIQREYITIYTNDKPAKLIIWIYKKETGWGERYEIPVTV